MMLEGSSTEDAVEAVKHGGEEEVAAAAVGSGPSCGWEK